MPQKQSLIEKIKENIVIEIVALIFFAAVLFFGNSALESMAQVQENKAKIILLQEKDETKEEQLENTAISIGDISSTTQRLEIAVGRLEEIVKILYEISIKTK